MEWNLKTVRKAFSDKLIGSSFMREQVCNAVLWLPPEMIATVTKGVWFISSQDDAWAFTFKGSDIKDRHLVFLSDELLSQSEKQIAYTILHEIGHVILGHSNSVGYLQTQTEIDKQEQEADVFAKRYLGY